MYAPDLFIAQERRIGPECKLGCSLDEGVPTLEWQVIVLLLLLKHFLLGQPHRRQNPVFAIIVLVHTATEVHFQRRWILMTPKYYNINMKVGCEDHTIQIYKINKSVRHHRLQRLRDSHQEALSRDGSRTRMHESVLHQ